jgi:hypothetical protein
MLGIQQPALKPFGFKQVKHRLPVIGCGLHRHQRDALAAQMVRQLQQRPGRRAVLAYLLAPPVGLVFMRNPDTGHQARLGDIERGHALKPTEPARRCRPTKGLPLHDQENEWRSPAGDSTGKKSRRTRVLKATMRGPSKRLPASDCNAASTRHQVPATSTGDHPRFSRPQGVPRRDAADCNFNGSSRRYLSRRCATKH